MADVITIKTCFDCTNATYGPRGLYCHEFAQWIFDEVDESRDCEAYTP